MRTSVVAKKTSKKSEGKMTTFVMSYPIHKAVVALRKKLGDISMSEFLRRAVAREIDYNSPRNKQRPLAAQENKSAS